MDRMSATLSLPSRPHHSQRSAAQPRLRSQDLFRGTHELIIEHQGQEYRLRLTRNDKLILNK
jgi:hemin uptake protein HemP